MHIIDKIVSKVGRRVDESSPMVDARLRDGSRVNAIIPPLAVDGPILSIRRFGTDPLTAEDLLRISELTAACWSAEGAVKARLNIIVSGGTGAGKTTLLNVLSGFISTSGRIVTIEDSAELQLKQAHVVRLECRPPNVEGKGARPPEGTADQCSAHAPGPHHRRRGARRRGAGHAAGHEHRPRRLAYHGARQHAARRAVADGDHGPDGEPQHAGDGDPRSRSPRRFT